MSGRRTFLMTRIPWHDSLMSSSVRHSMWWLLPRWPLACLFPWNGITLRPAQIFVLFLGRFITLFFVFEKYYVETLRHCKFSLVVVCAFSPIRRSGGWTPVGCARTEKAATRSQRTKRTLMSHATESASSKTFGGHSNSPPIFFLSMKKRPKHFGKVFKVTRGQSIAS